MTSATAGKPNHVMDGRRAAKKLLWKLTQIAFLKIQSWKDRNLCSKIVWRKHTQKKRKEKLEIIKNAVVWDGTTAGGRIWRREIIRTGQFLSEQRQGVCDIQVRFSLEVWISPFYVLVMGFIIWLMGCQSNLFHEGRDRHIKKVVFSNL